MVDGKQYVTVIAGYRGIGGGLDSRFGWEFYSQKRRVLTFALDGKAALPPSAPYNIQIVDDPAFQIDPKLEAEGARVYAARCYFCHGLGAVSGGTAPDLRASQAPLSNDVFADIVHKGSLASAGMPRFEDLSTEEIAALQNYIRSAARSTAAAK